MKFRVCAIAFLCLVAAVCHADSDCGWIGEKVGLCAAARQAGADAAKEIVKASENVFKSVNYFGSLVEDYNSTDAAKKARAMTILKSTFGDAFDVNKSAQWVVRLDVKGLDATQKPFRVIILKDHLASDTTISKDIKDATRSDWSTQVLRGAVPGAPDDPLAYKKSLDAIQTDIQARVLATIRAPIGLKNVCGAEYVQKHPGIMGYQISALQPCIEEKQSQMWAAAVMALADDRIDLRAKQLEATAQWLGEPFITFVIPNDDLTSNSKIEMVMSITEKSNKDLVVPGFEHGRQISARQMIAGTTYISSYPDDGGKYKAFTVRLQ